MPPAQLPSLTHVHLMPFAVAEPVTRTTPRHSPDPFGVPSTLRNPLNEELDCAKPLMAPFISVAVVRQAPSTQSTPVCTICAEMSRVVNADDSRVPVHVPVRLGMVGSVGCVGAGGVVVDELALPQPTFSIALTANADATDTQYVAQDFSRAEATDIYRP